MLTEITQQSLDPIIKIIGETAQDLSPCQSLNLHVESEIGPLAVEFDLDAEGVRARGTIMLDDDETLDPIRQAVREHKDAEAPRRYGKLIASYQQPARSKATDQRRGRGKLR